MNITLKVCISDTSVGKTKMCLRGMSWFTFGSVASFQNLSLQSPKLDLDVQIWGQKISEFCLEYSKHKSRKL